jgi:hypothetical protein
MVVLDCNTSYLEEKGGGKHKTICKITENERDQGHGSSGRVLASQAQGDKFKPQYHE